MGEEKLFNNADLLDLTADELSEIPRADETVESVEETETKEETPAKDRKEEGDDNKEETIERHVVSDEDDSEDDLTDELGDKKGFKEETEDKKETGDEEAPENSEDSTPSKNSENASSPYSPFAKALLDEGVLPQVSDEDWEKLKEENEGDEAKALIALNKLSVDQAIDSYKNTLDEDIKDIVEAREKGYNIEEYKKIKSNKFQLDKINEDSLADDEKLQKQILTQDMKERGYSDDEIEDNIELYESSDKLADKATKAFKRQKDLTAEKEEAFKQEQEQLKKQSQANYQKQLKSIESKINDAKEIIPGYKLNKASRDNLYKSMTEPVDFDEQGRPISSVIKKRSEDPMDFEMKLHYFVQLGLFDGKFDKLKRTTKTSAVDELREKLNSNSSVPKGSTRTTRTSKEDDEDLKRGFGSIKLG